MKIPLLFGLLALGSFTIDSVRAANDAADTAEMAAARQAGVTVLQLMQENLKPNDKPAFPGIQAWLRAEGQTLGKLDKDKPAGSWRKLDADKLITHNTNFWQLYYEIVPGDPGLAMLHAGSLLAAGDAERAQIVLRLTLHRGDLNEETKRILLGILQHCGQFMQPSHQLVRDGITLHDQGKFNPALAKYDAALKLWPLNGWATYERGTTLRIRDGEGAAVTKAFAQSRRLQPFQQAAWQGEVKDLPGMLTMHKVVLPLWEKSLKDIKYEMTKDELWEFCQGLQEAELDDLALIARQILIVRKGRYLPEDHPFITKSLRRLVPGKQAETTITKLAGDSFETVQLFKAPVPGKKPEE